MEISDEERHEVAARMRDIMRRYPRCFLDNMVAQSVLDVMGDGVKIGETVADLIDRPTCRNIGGEEGTNGEHYDFFCSACGCAANIAEPNYCPECGAEVVYKANDCSAKVESYNGLEDAVAGWNARAIDRDKLLEVVESLEKPWPVDKGNHYTIPCEDVQLFEREMASRIRKAVGE